MKDFGNPKDKLRLLKRLVSYFEYKEIILRSGAKTRVLKLFPVTQLVIICLTIGIFSWASYATYTFLQSVTLITDKDKLLTESREAYKYLMADIQVYNKKIQDISEILNEGKLDKKKSKKIKSELTGFKSHIEVVEKRLEEINDGKEWAELSKDAPEVLLRTAVLQRDIANSERDELKKQIDTMEKFVSDLKETEENVLSKVEKLTSNGINDIKKLIKSINVPLKNRGLYFNSVASKLSDNGKGGPYIPVDLPSFSDNSLDSKVRRVFKSIDDWGAYKDIKKYLPVGKPIKRYWVTAPFGYRSDPFRKTQAFHEGIDLGSKAGQKVVTQARGVVKKAKNNGNYGLVVYLDHGNGFQTRYAHLQKIYVEKGDYVDENTEIGEVGSTGRSTGPHLHYEVRYKNIPIDPAKFVINKK